MKRNYIRVKASDEVADMTRFMSYASRLQDGSIGNYHPATDEPVALQWKGGKVSLHRLERGGYVYFMQPSILNKNWCSNAIGRYASFGKKAELVRLEVDPSQ